MNSVKITNRDDWLRNAYGYGDANARKDGVLVQDLGWINYCYSTLGIEIAVQEAKKLGYTTAKSTTEMLKFVMIHKKVAMINAKDVQLADPPNGY
jgi:hypothetical protein